jgi:uncharacterized protein YcbX
MILVGRVESVWRYPVKSMRGEELREAFAGFGGVYGDRVFAFRSSAAPKGFPYLTAREQQQMLLYQPAFRDPVLMTAPPNMAEAYAISPNILPLYPDVAQVVVDVTAPSGEQLGIHDPRLAARLGETQELSLLRSDRAMTDCRPLSLFSIQTARHLNLDKRRFRANVYLDLTSQNAFGEDEFVGHRLRIGNTQIAVLDRDSRCKMITLDPDTAEPNPEIMKDLARSRDSQAGVYAAVLVEGTIRAGDEITLLS